MRYGLLKTSRRIKKKGIAMPIKQYKYLNDTLCNFYEKRKKLLKKQPSYTKAQINK